MIETTPHPMTVIAYVCGFADAAHFSREFRATVGATPTQFREVVRPLPAVPSELSDRLGAARG